MDFRTHKKYINGVFKTKAEIEAELRAKGITKIYYVLSFGGGTQSTHLLEDHFRGKIHYDFIIMSDTGAEPNFIHQQVNWWKERQRKLGNKTPFYITTHSKMKHGIEEMSMRWINTDYKRFQLPVYLNEKDPVTGEIKKAGIMPRQCTVDFKIIPVKQLARQLVLKELGLKPRQRLPKHIAFIIDIGFSADEIKRINLYQSPQYKYMYLAYPLVEMNLSTNDSIRFLNENHMPKKRSRCYCCPFNCDMSGMDWKEIINDEPLSFLKAVWLDQKFRETQATGDKPMRAIPYLHYTRTPLKDVFYQEYLEIFNKYKDELNAWLIDWDVYINKYYGVDEVA